MIVIVYVNDQAVVPALTRAKAAGIPVVLVVVPLRKEHEDLFMSYVARTMPILDALPARSWSRAFSRGQDQGADRGRDRRRSGSTTSRPASKRSRRAGQAAGYELVAAEDGKWNTALSEKITGELLVRFNARGGVDGVYGMADNQATGAIRAIESAGLKLGVANKGIVVVASNCMKDGVVISAPVNSTARRRKSRPKSRESRPRRSPHISTARS